MEQFNKEIYDWFMSKGATDKDIQCLTATTTIIEGFSFNYDWLQENNLWEEFQEKFIKPQL